MWHTPKSRAIGIQRGSERRRL